MKKYLQVKEIIMKKIALKYSYLFVAAALLALVLSELVVLASEIISQAVNSLIEGKNVDTKELLLNAGIITALSMVVSFLKTIIGELFSIKVQKECKSIAVKSFEKVEYRFFENNSGTVINKLTSDISDIGKLMSEILPAMLQYTITIIVMSMALVKINGYIFVIIKLTYNSGSTLLFC